MKSLEITLSGVGRGHAGSDLTKVQGKSIRDCHNESPLYNEYMLIKMKQNKSFPSPSCKAIFIFACLVQCLTFISLS
jgi:hypothetical protein